MTITEKQAKDIIEICSNPVINEINKIKIIMSITNNNIEILLAKMKGRLED